MFRKMAMDAIREDPDWKNGDYTAEPQESLKFAADIFILASSAPLRMQKSAPTRDDADKLLADSQKRLVASFDASSVKSKPG